MKLVYAPSGKRMVPYPPVGPAVLAGALREAALETPRIVDLEMLAWREHRTTGEMPLYSALFAGRDWLTGSGTDELRAYGASLARLAEIADAEDVGISVMGFEQLPSALALATVALERGSRVIFGGQYWNERSAREILLRLGTPRATVVVGDGWDSVVGWVLDPGTVPPNAFALRDGELVKGATGERIAKPPEPSYATLDWAPYEFYGTGSYGDAAPVRRAHLYVWDKLCPYKCNFCRVSSGSKAQLLPPDRIVSQLRALLQDGVTEMNFMTNELNPSLAYLRRLIAAFAPELTGREDVGWFTYLRPDHMERGDLENLRALGCRLARYGVETGSQRLSDRMQKGYTIEIVERVLAAAADADIMNHVNFLVGYPGETEEDVEETLRFIDRNHQSIHSVRLNPFYLSPGSALATRPHEYGIRLTTFRGGYWDFEMLGGTAAPSGTIAERIERITQRLKDYGIGFAAVLPFETLSRLKQHPSRDAALAAMRRSLPFLWETASPEELKSRMGQYATATATGWADTIYKRGRNYNTMICTD